MNLFTQTPRDPNPISPITPYIEIVEPESCHTVALPPEGNAKVRNYRLLNENIRAYTPTGDVHTSSNKDKLVARYEVCANLSPPRAKILELLRPEDPGREALEAIVRPTPRRGLTRPLDDDTRRFLQRALQAPNSLSVAAPESQKLKEKTEVKNEAVSQTNGQRSLADELKEAEEEESTGSIRQELLQEFKKRSGIKDAVERERMGRLALSVEEDETYEESGLRATARRLDSLLAESRGLHDELAEIHEDLQAQSARACRCVDAARALGDEARALRYLDDVVALLRGDVAAAVRVRAWPFAIGRRQPGRNYII